MRFIHTSDWQIGKKFLFADNDTLSVLQNQRLEAITRLGRLAREHDARHILVAGDIYDQAIPGDRTLREPIERMRQFAGVHWHLIPGNHDPHTIEGIWDRLRAIGVPENVRLHLSPDAAQLDDSAWILPGVLVRRHMAQDPSAVMDNLVTPPGAIRIGLAHGPVTGFGDAEPTPNLIALDRAERSGLAYLALGDWHGARRINERSWYCGTPETDGFDRGGEGGGHALLVTLDGPAARPEVTKLDTGHFLWRRTGATLANADDVDALEHRLRALENEDLSRVLVWLRVEGALRIAALEYWEERIVRGLGSALRLLRLDGAPSLLGDAEDLDRFGSGAIMAAARALAERAAQDDIAAAALQRLFVLSAQKGTAA